MEGHSARLMDYQAPAASGALAAEIAALGPWFHNLHLPDGSRTAPHHPLGDFPANQWAQLAPHLPEDLAGCDVLDIGCNAGFYALELARRGARVVGLEPDPHFLRQAAWAAERHGVSDRLELLPWQVYRLPELDRVSELAPRVSEGVPCPN